MQCESSGTRFTGALTKILNLRNGSLLDKVIQLHNGIHGAMALGGITGLSDFSYGL